MRIILFGLLLSCLQTIAQGGHNKFQWQAAPALHKVDEAFASEAAVVVEENKITEYVVEKDGFYSYKTMHRIVHINNDKGIEYFNKVYLPFDEGIQMTDVRARTILPDGKIIQLDQSNIKDLKENDRNYKIFALDGLTNGCEIEYYYTIKKYPSYFGREMFSSQIPVMKSHFELVSPAHLRFEAKGYNNLPALKDSTFNGKRYIRMDAEKIKGEEEEKYSMYEANLKRIEYKLCYNDAQKSSLRMFTWNELAKKAYELYTTAPEKQLKKINDVLADAGIENNMPEKDKIIKLESYFKKNFIAREDLDVEDATDLAKVVKNKVMSERAFCKLLCIALSAANVNYQVVLAGDRSDYSIDKSFENWNNARHFLLYFPLQKKYMAPTANAFRFPWIPPTWTETNALHCVVTTLGGYQSAIAEIKKIPMEDIRYSYQNMEIKAALDKAGESIDLDIKHSYGGYTAPNYRAPFIFYPPDEQQKILKELIKFSTNSENIISHSFENKEIDQEDPYKPFVINAKVKSTQLSELAGSKVIVKIGEFIGPQVQMYDVKERTTDIDVNFPNKQIRTIELTIPDGYEIKNLKDLNINQVYKENGEQTMAFVCTYELKGNVLKVIIDEQYNRFFYPLKNYEAFKKIINSSADFNKLVLVLDKKS